MIPQKVKVLLKEKARQTPKSLIGSIMLLIFICALPMAVYPGMRRLSILFSEILLVPLVWMLINVTQRAVQPASRLAAVVVLIFSSALTVTIFPSANRIINSLEPALKHPWATYDEKMTMRWGKHYEFIIFVRDHTSSNTIVVIPPSDITYNGGNFWAPFEEYFLYPRQVMDGKNTSQCMDYENSKAPVVMIAINNPLGGWPGKYVEKDFLPFDSEIGLLTCSGGALLP